MVGRNYFFIENLLSSFRNKTGVYVLLKTVVYSCVMFSFLKVYIVSTVVLCFLTFFAFRQFFLNEILLNSVCCIKYVDRLCFLFSCCSNALEVSGLSVYSDASVYFLSMFNFPTMFFNTKFEKSSWTPQY